MRTAFSYTPFAIFSCTLFACSSQTDESLPGENSHGTLGGNQRVVTHITDRGTEVVVLQTIEAMLVDEDASVQPVSIPVDSEGRFEFDHVPDGPLYISDLTGQNYYVTELRDLNLNEVVWGRTDRTLLEHPETTGFDLSVSGMEASSVGDAITLNSVGANMYYSAQFGLAGVTSFDDVRFPLTYPVRGLPDTSQGDIVYVLQERPGSDGLSRGVVAAGEIEDCELEDNEFVDVSAKLTAISDAVDPVRWYSAEHEQLFAHVDELLSVTFRYATMSVTLDPATHDLMNRVTLASEFIFSAPEDEVVTVDPTGGDPFPSEWARQTAVVEIWTGQDSATLLTYATVLPTEDAHGQTLRFDIGAPERPMLERLRGSTDSDDALAISWDPPLVGDAVLYCVNVISDYSYRFYTTATELVVPGRFTHDLATVIVEAYSAGPSPQRPWIWPPRYGRGSAQIYHATD